MPFGQTLPSDAFNAALLAPKPYIGQVGTRCWEATAKLQGANFIQSNDVVFCPAPLPAGTIVTVGWGFWFSSAMNEQYLTGTTTVDPRLLLGGTFISSNEGIAAFDMGGSNKLLLRTFTLPNYVPAFYPIQVRVLQDGAGVFWRQGQIKDQAHPLQGMYGPNNGTRPAVTDAMPGGAFSEYSFPPVLFCAQTTAPSVLAWHDSREECGEEGGRPPYYMNGLTLPAIGAHCGWSSMGHSGSGVSQFNSAANTAQRLALAPYFSHVMDAWGINDLQTYARSSAQLLSDKAIFAAKWPNNIVFGTTIPTVCASTDGFATLANQTFGSVVPALRIVNEGIVAGIQGHAFVLDTRDAMDPLKTYKFPVTRNPADVARPTACTFTGSISGSTLTVTAVTSGTLNINDPLVDSLTSATPAISGCTILDQLTGTTGGVGTYRISRPQTLASKTLYVGGYGCNDTLHQTADLSEQVKQKLLPVVRMMIRR